MAFNYLYCLMSTRTKKNFLIGLVSWSHCFMALIGVNIIVIVRIRCVFRKKQTFCEIWINGNHKIGKIIYYYNNQIL